ncbi:MAG: hypothetical protein AAF844_17350, partial [Pseudomonadota bacterium]
MRLLSKRQVKEMVLSLPPEAGLGGRVPPGRRMTDEQARRRFTPEFKEQLAARLSAPGATQ